MELSLNFNANEVQPASSDFEPIPAGWYQCVLEKAELKPTKAGTGAYISLMAKVQGPTHANRVIFGNLNYQNPNPQAQEIGQRQLSALCHAVNVFNLSNVQQLMGIPFEARIKVTAPTYNVAGDVNSGVLYEAKNEFLGFRAVGAGQAIGGSAPVNTAPSAPGAPGAPTAPQSAPQQAPQQAPVQQPVQQQVVQQAPVQQQQVAQQGMAQADAAIAGVTTQPSQPW